MINSTEVTLWNKILKYNLFISEINDESQFTEFKLNSFNITKQSALIIMI